MNKAFRRSLAHSTINNHQRRVRALPSTITPYKG
jgi:hypothetical protein